MKKIALLGSTGSIGQSTLRVARHLKDKIQIKALAAKSNIDLLEAQAKEFHPDLIAVYDEDKALLLQKKIPQIPVLAGLEGLNAVASHTDVNFVVSAMSGTIGITPTVTAIKAGKNIGLANKEALVAGGAIVMALAKKHKVEILPIDSEHSAIFQCLNGSSPSSIRRLILTASGGPFRDCTNEQLMKISPEQALCHPTWTMGAKVTIDSSTLMNKGLEVIEAHWLFEVPLAQISVVIHPQSIIHSMVEFVDNSLIAQLGESQMITPIQYAMMYPERLPGLLQQFDIMKHPTLQFFEPDLEKFRCLRLAYEAAQTGGSLPCFMNAANEILVTRFLEKRLAWQELGTKLESLMQSHQIKRIESLEDVLSVDAEARLETARILD